MDIGGSPGSAKIAVQVVAYVSHPVESEGMALTEKMPMTNNKVLKTLNQNYNYYLLILN